MFTEPEIRKIMADDNARFKEVDERYRVSMDIFLSSVGSSNDTNNKISTTKLSHFTVSNKCERFDR